MGTESRQIWWEKHIFIACKALTKQGDNALGSIRPSVRFNVSYTVYGCSPGYTVWPWFLAWASTLVKKIMFWQHCHLALRSKLKVRVKVKGRGQGYGSRSNFCRAAVDIRGFVASPLTLCCVQIMPSNPKWSQFSVANSWKFASSPAGDLPRKSGSPDWK